jgi:hypothetical protein
MSLRGFLVSVSLVATAAAFFVLGSRQARLRGARESVPYHTTADAIRADVRYEADTPRTPKTVPAATSGSAVSAPLEKVKPAATNDNIADHAEMVAEIKREIESEMGLLPVQLLRDRRSSFVGLDATDDAGRINYGTAGYLGHGYFITVKHVVMALKDGDRPTARKIVSIAVVMNDGKEIPATLVDAGDAKAEVDRGDWAIVQTKELDLPALHPDVAFAYEFADPIFRLGNDYSKGIILSTGYVGQRTANGLVTCLTDGHPGVSGGGVLDQRGDLVGIPIGRMEGDYRFSFILPLRAEMLRKVPFIEHAQPVGTFADAR